MGLEDPKYINMNEIKFVSNKDEYIALKDFISNEQVKYLTSYKSMNQRSPPPAPTVTCNDNAMERAIQKYSNHDDLQNEYIGGYNQCSSEQRLCLDNLRNALEISSHDSTAENLLMVVSGEGGTGKSFVIHLARVLCKITIGKTYGLYGPMLAIAPTGSAANAIEGFTSHSALKIGRGRGSITEDNARDLASMLRGTEVIVFDEMSLTSKEHLSTIHFNLMSARKVMVVQAKKSVFGTSARLLNHSEDFTLSF